MTALTFYVVRVYAPPVRGKSQELWSSVRTDQNEAVKAARRKVESFNVDRKAHRKPAMTFRATIQSKIVEFGKEVDL